VLNKDITFVFVYDKATEKINIGSAKDIYPGSKAFVTSRINNIKNGRVVK